MKKLTVLLLSALLLLAVFGCTKEEQPKDDKTLEHLSIVFVPSKDPEQIKDAAKGLPALLAKYLADEGYTIDPEKITVDVGSNYEVVGEGLAAGSIDLGFIPAGNYVTVHDTYPEDVNLLLASSRASVSVDVDYDGSDFKNWNLGPVTDRADIPAGGYRSLMYVNIGTEKGKDLYDKAYAGTLTWEDFQSATIACGSPTSGASYKYPSAWLNQRFGTGVGNAAVTLENLKTTEITSYSSAMEALLGGQVDICFGYADVRKDAASTTALDALKADGKFTEYETVFDVIKVIGVSDMIMNDTISYGADEMFTPELVKALQNAFINLIKTDEGKACVAPYSHAGYVVVKDSDYDGFRAVTELFK